jgi:hypothetical protein
MTTPGRTHIPWQTETAHIRELISYINFLEAKLSYLQYHHEHCDTWVASPVLGGNMQYLPPDIVTACDQANDEANDESRAPQVISTMAAASLTARRPSVKSPKCNPRWKQIIDQITKGWDKPNSWIEKREAIGLNSKQNKYALQAILGLPSKLDESPTSVFPACINGTDDLVALAQQYALNSKAAHRNTALDGQVHIFRELVFASLCVVMEHQGLPIDTIDGLMRICISSSGAANLYRLRRGALWINRVISGTMMNKMGWGHGSTEFFFLCRCPSYNR